MHASQDHGCNHEVSSPTHELKYTELVMVVIMLMIQLVLLILISYSIASDINEWEPLQGWQGCSIVIWWG